MIKVETIGMLDNAVLNSALKSDSAEIANYTFVTDEDAAYLIYNTVAGDDAYVDDITFAKGEYVNCYNLKAWENQKLIIDEKHIAYDERKSYSDIVPDSTLLKIDESGKLKITEEAPESGVYFKVTDKCRLTGNAVKAKIIVV